MSMPQPILPSLPSVKLVNGKIQTASILLVGDYPSEQDEKQGIVFSSNAGRELDSLLADAGLRRSSIAITNLFNTRPPQSSLLHWSASKKDAEAEIIPGRPWSPIQVDTGKYVRASIVQPALERLRQEILSVRPNVIVALGGTAMAALTGVSGIGRVRGSLYLSTLVGGYRTQQDGSVLNEPHVKVIGTYHPSAVFRQYDLRPMVEVDLLKAKAESEFPELRLRRRALYLEPTLDDLLDWQRVLCAAPALAVDCETKNGQITCVGFSPDATSSYVIPFWDRRKPDWSYWPDTASEIFAWRVCRTILLSPAEKILQNGLYDLQYFLRYRWPMRRFIHDTMIKHHSLYPGLPKGLDFLGSIYANERAWKKFRPRGGEEKSDA